MSEDIRMALALSVRKLRDKEFQVNAFVGFLLDSIFN